MIKIYKPKSNLLEKYIDFFYVIKRNEHENPITYFGFPSNIVFLTMIKNSKVLVNENELIIEGQIGDNISSVLIVDTQKQAPCTYKGACDEITIYFKPLGINSFLSEPLCNYIKGSISEFNPYDDYRTTIKSIFQSTDNEDRIAQLENYLLAKFNNFEHPFLYEAVQKALDTNQYPIKVEALAKAFNTSRTTLHKEFLKHIGTNPNQFIKIERFRKAVRQFTTNSTKEQLTDIAYMAEYFDQSHMIKDFKALTGYSPKTFFSKLSQLENGTINWIFF